MATGSPWKPVQVRSQTANAKTKLTSGSRRSRCQFTRPLSPTAAMV
jgi:hypothetical protein